MRNKKIRFQLGVAGSGMVILGIMAICLWLSIMGVKNYYLLSNYQSQAITFIPADADIYSSINFYPVIWQLKNTKEGTQTEEIKKLRKLLTQFEEKNGLNIENELLSWLEPEASLALFHTQKIYQYTKARGKLEKCKQEIYSLTCGLDEYYKKNQCYPADIKELTKEYMEKLPSCPAGGKYQYKPEGEKNQEFVLECTENAHKEAGVTGKYPAYRGEKGKGNFIACNEEIPQTAYPDWLILTAIKDRGKAENFIKGISEKNQWKTTEQEYKNNKIITVETETISYCLTEKNLLAASNADIIKNSLDVFSGEKDNIGKNRLYTKFIEKSPESRLAFAFVNLENILPPVYGDISEEPWNKIGPPALKGLKSFGITASGTSGGIKIDSFLDINKESESAIIKILQEKNMEKLDSLKLVPDDITILSSSSDLKLSWKIGKELLQYSPKLQEQYDSINKLFALFAQMDIEKDIIDNLTGEITLTMTSTPEYLEGLKKAETVEKCQRDLYDIAEGVIAYQKANSGAIPDKVEDLSPDYLEELPQGPENGKYIIVKEISKEGKENIYPSFYVAYSGELNIPQIKKDFPRYYSDVGPTLGKDENGEEITLPVPMPDTLILLGIKNKEPFTKLLSLASIFCPGKIQENTYRGVAYSGFNNETNKITSPFNVSYSFLKNYFVISMGKTKSPMEKTIDTFLLNRKSIDQSRDYKIAIKQIPSENLSNFSFANLQNLTEISQVLPEHKMKKEMEEEARDFSNQFSVAWSSSRMEDDGFHWSVFIPLKF